jgi:predicted SAM-dependent methyltransferase
MFTQKELRIVVGAGVFAKVNPLFNDWLLTEEDELNLLKRNDWEERLSPNTVKIIVAEHVWEHLTYIEGIEAAKICYEFLKPGGRIRCAVPDGYFPNEAYQLGVQIGGPGPAEHPAASHRIVHNHNTLTSMFETVGYEVSLLEYCDENGEFHYQEWDETMGFIYRSQRFDHRNKDGKLGFVSLIIDATKPTNVKR